MPGIEQVKLDILQVPLVRFGPGRREDLIVPAPDDKCRRLVFPEILLPLGIQGGVAPVAQEHVELDLVVPLSVEQVLVVGPAVRADGRHVLHPVGVLPLRGVRFQEPTQGVTPLRAGRLFPIRLDRFPEVVVEPLFIGVPVLHHQGGHAGRVLNGEPVTDRGTVILHVQGVSRQPGLLDELVDHVGHLVEGVGEGVPRRHRALAEPGIVGGDDMVPVRQCRDQVAEHVRAGGKAVQQEHNGRVLRAGLPVEDVEIADLDHFVAHFCNVVWGGRHL